MRWSYVRSMNPRVDETQLWRNLAAALIASSGERVEDAYLLWYLGDMEGAIERFELGWREGAQMCALPLWWLDREHATEARLGAAIAALDLLEGSTRRSFARAVFAELWLRQNEGALASQFALEALLADPACEVMPIPGQVIEVDAERWVALWSRVVEAEDWESALRVLCVGAMLEMPLFSERECAGLLARLRAFWPLLVWCGDHAPLEDLDADRIERFAQGLSDPTEAQAFRVLGVEVLERTDPLSAARRFQDLAESGADELFAVARLRAQRAYVRAGALEEASGVARARAELCGDERLAHALLLVSGLYALRTRPEEALQALRWVLKASVERRFVGASAMASPVLELFEGLLDVESGRDAVRSFYDDLEGWLPGMSSDVFRRYERILLLGDEIMMMSVVQLLEHVVVSWPELLPVAFELALVRLGETELVSRLQQLERHALLRPLVTPLLAALRAVSGAPEGLEAGFVGPELATIRALFEAWGSGDSAAQQANLEGLCEHTAPRVRVASRCLLAWQAMSRADGEQAHQHLVVAAEMAPQHPPLLAVIDRLAQLSRSPDRARAILTEAEHQRFLKRLEHHPRALSHYQRAGACSRQGHWSRGGQELLAAAQHMDEAWVRARLFEMAATWLGERALDWHAARDASQAALETESNLGRCQMHARILAEEGDFASLHRWLEAHPEVPWSSALLEACLRVWRGSGEHDPALSTMLFDRLERPESVRGGLDLRTLEGAVDTLLEAGRVADARRMLLGLVNTSQHVVLLATASLLLGGLEAEHFDDDREATRYLRAALVHPETRQRALDAMVSLHEIHGRWSSLVDFLLSAAEDVGELSIEADCLLTAIDVLCDHLDEPGRARRVLERVLKLDPERCAVQERRWKLARLTGSRDEERQALADLIALASEPDERARYHLAMAELWTELGELERGLDCERDAFVDAPTSAPAFERVTLRLLERERFTDFLAVHQAAIRAVREGRIDMPLESLFARQAAVQLVALEQPREAARSLTEALRIRPHELSYFEDIVSIAEDIADPLLEARALDARLEALPPDDDERLELLERAATLYELRLDLPGRAAERWRALAGRLPEAERAHIQPTLERLYTEAEDWPRLAECLRDALALAHPERACHLLERLARLEEHELDAPERALKAYEDWLRRAPDEPRAREGVMRLYERLERWRPLLERCLLETQRVSPGERAPWLLKMARIYARYLDEPERAERCFQTVLGLEPGHLEAARELVALYRLQQQPELHLKVLEHLLLEAPEETSWALLEIVEVAWTHGIRGALADESFERLLHRVESLQAERVQVVLELMSQRGDWGRAARLANALLSREQEDSAADRRVYTALGILGHGRPQAALDTLQQALESEPEDAMAWVIWRAVLEEVGLDEPRVRFLEGHIQALKERFVPELLVDGLLMLGRSCEAWGDIVRAQDALAQALRYTVRTLESLRALVRLKVRLRDVEGACAVCRQTARRHSGRTEVVVAARKLEATLVRDSLGDGERATALFQTLYDELGDDALRWDIAQAQALAGEWRAACENMAVLARDDDLEAASDLALEARQAMALRQFYWGRMLDACGEHGAAAKRLSDAMRLAPEEPRVILGALRNGIWRGDWAGFEALRAEAEVRLHEKGRLRWLEVVAARERGEEQAMVRALERLTQACPEDIEAHLELARWRGDPWATLCEAIRAQPLAMPLLVGLESLEEVAARPATLDMIAEYRRLTGYDEERPAPRVAWVRRGLRRADLERCRPRSLMTPWCRALVVLRPLLLEHLEALEMPEARRNKGLRGEARERFEDTQEQVSTYFAGRHRPSIEGWRAGASGMRLEYRSRAGFRAHVHPEELAGAGVQMMVSRCFAMHLLGVEPLIALPPDALAAWIFWLRERGAGRAARLPMSSLRPRDEQLVIEMVSAATSSFEDEVAHAEALAAGVWLCTDRVALVLSGGLQASLEQIFSLEWGMDKVFQSPRKLREYVAGSERARGLIGFALSESYSAIRETCYHRG